MGRFDPANPTEVMGPSDAVGPVAAGFAASVIGAPAFAATPAAAVPSAAAAIASSGFTGQPSWASPAGTVARGGVEGGSYGPGPATGTPIHPPIQDAPAARSIAPTPGSTARHAPTPDSRGRSTPGPRQRSGRRRWRVLRRGHAAPWRCRRPRRGVPKRTTHRTADRDASRDAKADRQRRSPRRRPRQRPPRHRGPRRVPERPTSAIPSSDSRAASMPAATHRRNSSPRSGSIFATAGPRSRSRPSCSCSDVARGR